MGNEKAVPFCFEFQIFKNKSLFGSNHISIKFPSYYTNLFAGILSSTAQTPAAGWDSVSPSPSLYAILLHFPCAPEHLSIFPKVTLYTSIPLPVLQQTQAAQCLCINASSQNVLATDISCTTRPGSWGCIQHYSAFSHMEPRSLQ